MNLEVVAISLRRRSRLARWWSRWDVIADMAERTSNVSAASLESEFW